MIAPGVALVVTTDGRRDCLTRALSSLEESLQPWPRHRVVVDDSGDPGYAAFVAEQCRGFQRHFHARREGFAQTVEDAWRLAFRLSQIQYVFHAEDDFVYNEPVDLDAMVAILETNPRLAQIALKRQPVNDSELAAGDFMLTLPAETWDQHEGWIEHTLNFTTNPSLIPRHAIETALQDTRLKTEPHVTGTLLAAGYRFGYLGSVEDSPRVEHIGLERMAGWAQ